MHQRLEKHGSSDDYGKRRRYFRKERNEMMEFWGEGPQNNCGVVFGVKR